MKKLDSQIRVHHTSLDGNFLGNRVRATDGCTDMEGPLESVRHEIDDELRSVSVGTVRVTIRTYLVIGGHELRVARGAEVTVLP